MTTITYYQAVEALTAIYRLAEEYDCPFDVSARLRQGVRILKPHVDDLEAERLKLLDKYAERDDENKKVVERTLEDGTITYKLDDREAFDEGVAASRKATISVDVEWALPASTLEKFKPRPKPILGILLGPLLIEDDQPAPSNGKKKRR